MNIYDKASIYNDGLDMAFTLATAGASYLYADSQTERDLSPLSEDNVDNLADVIPWIMLAVNFLAILIIAKITLPSISPFTPLQDRINRIDGNHTEEMDRDHRQGSILAMRSFGSFGYRFGCWMLTDVSLRSTADSERADLVTSGTTFLVLVIVKVGANYFAAKLPVQISPLAIEATPDREMTPVQPYALTDV